MATLINLPEQPVIKVTAGSLHKIVARAHRLLAKEAEGLFQYGGILCVPFRVPTTITHKDGRTVPEGTIELVQVTKDWLRLELCRLARWQRAKERKAKEADPEWYDC